MLFSEGNYTWHSSRSPITKCIWGLSKVILVAIDWATMSYQFLEGNRLLDQDAKLRTREHAVNVGYITHKGSGLPS
jgi:hypothetical protein